MAKASDRSKPAANSETVSRSMRDMPESDTGPEMLVRRLLFRAGFRYRVQYPVPGRKRRSIDIAFPGKRLAIFIDGCFWHGCSEHRTIPAHNARWWADKIQTNRKRDEDTTLLLQEAGWQVFRFWEHDDPTRIVESVRTFFKRGEK
ncbi:MAG: very short patch repair endonuclease [Thiobacillus sp.]|nr:very short patch repair endonuclease [Thiobacillus sp.]